MIKFNMKLFQHPVCALVILLSSLTSDVISQCTDADNPTVLISSSTLQYLTSPNYPSLHGGDLDCHWRIDAPTNAEKVIVNIEFVELEEEIPTCEYDSLNVYDGSSTDDTLLATTCEGGTNIHGFVTTGQSAYFNFITDDSIFNSGFNILYFTPDAASQPACDSTGLAATATAVSVMSENLPSPYTRGYTCSWGFTTTDTYIKFVFKYMDLAETASCADASVIIYDGSDNLAVQVSNQCTKAETYTFADVVTTGNVAFLEFKVSATADISTPHYGFSLTYESVFVPTTVNPLTSLNTDCIDATTLTAATTHLNLLASVNFGSSNYINNMECKWIITAPTNYAVEVQFTGGSFSVESHTYCSYDSVSFYDGTSTVDPILNKFCGSTLVTTAYRSSGVNFLIYFTTDGSVTSTGFKALYQAVDISYPTCESSYTAYAATTTVQTISTPTSPYANNLDEYWLITNAGALDLVFALTAMDVERAHGCIYDKITIYDGSCPSFPVLESACGTFLKRWDLTGTGYLVQFHSDGSVTGSGFTMEYYTVAATTAAAPTTTTTTNGPPIEAEIAVINNVLTNYSNENLPVRDLSISVASSVDLYLVGINDLDEVAQKLTTTMLFVVTWKDANLAWDPTKALGLSTLLMPQDDIWKPDIALINGFETITAMGASFMFVVVNADGSCTWKPYQIMESVCKVDMSKYPYDTQTCKLKFTTWGATSDQVLTSIGGNGIQKHDSFQENSEWTLLSIAQSLETVDGQVIAVFTLSMQRNHAFIVFYVAIPVIMLSFLNAFTFALPVSSGEKSGYVITVFLSFVVYVIVAFQKMPENSDTISLFAVFVLINTILSALATMITTLEIRMIELNTKHKPILTCTVLFTKAVIRLQRSCFCIKAPDVEEREEVENDDDDDVDGNEAWVELVSALDFICFIVFLVMSGVGCAVLFTSL